MLGRSYRKEASEDARRGATANGVLPGTQTTVVLGKLLSGTSWPPGRVRTGALSTESWAVQ